MRRLHHSHHRVERHLDSNLVDLNPQAINEEAMALEKRTPQVETQVSVVFVTASKTFDGPVAGYTTMLPSGFGINDGTLSASSAPQPTSQPNQNTPAPAPQSSTKPRHTTEQSQPSEVASTTQSAAQSSPLGTSSSPSETSSRNTHAPSTLTSPSAPTITSGAPSKISSLTISPTESSSLQATTPESGDTAPAVSSSPSESSGNSGGLSGGAKAGLAIGIILLIALIAGGAFFLYRYKKRQDESHEKLEDDEKTAATGAGAFVPAREPSVRSTRTPTNAPRLSLRPLTQFSPNLGGAPATVGNKLEMTSNPSGASQQPKSMWERPGERNDITEKSNPFGDHAASAAAPVAAGAVAGAAVGAAVRSKANDRRRSSGVVPKPLSIKSNHSQTSLDSEVSSAHTGTLSSANISEFHLGTASTASSAIPASVAASSVPSSLAAPSGPPSNVHRVQMEFKPSMEDELELLPGQIVRILHEYDDGWALCIRMDRSQQGVAPRTCLSKLPLKPRPIGPQGQQPGPRPTSPLPMRPPVGPASMVPRPLTPNSGRNSPIDPFADAAAPRSGRARSKSNASAAQPPSHLGLPSGASAGGQSQQSRRRSKSVTDLQPMAYQGPQIPFGHASTSSMGSVGSVPARKPVPGQPR